MTFKIPKNEKPLSWKIPSMVKRTAKKDYWCFICNNGISTGDKIGRNGHRVAHWFCIQQEKT